MGFARDLDLVIVPGVGDSGPGHWQTLWETESPRAKRVVQDDWSLSSRGDWVARLQSVMADQAGPCVLVGHSAGAVTIVHWAQQPGSLVERVQGAFLVAPPDFDAPLPEGFPRPGTVAELGWSPLPLSPLPFPTCLVASSNDPFDPHFRSPALARSWKAVFRHAGALGHINLAAGFGPWEQGRAWFEEFCRDLVPER
ncbi:MAG: alpha/beta fold hydrolase [Fibrobacteria bacterium]|nr:alpha/beta fold hydrolase [Fibrobacteria bacterium]